jgi:hypothetical protein
MALFALPALAGSVTITNGQVTWQSNQCQAPATPAMGKPNSETRANDMNARVTEYNNYASAAQAYMNCLSNEAQHDAGAVSQSIAGQAQVLISAAQQNVTDLGASFHHAEAAPAPAPIPMAMPKPTAPPTGAAPTQAGTAPDNAAPPPSSAMSATTSAPATK